MGVKWGQKSNDILRIKIFMLKDKHTEAGDLNLLIAGERMRIFLSLPSKSKAPAAVEELIAPPAVSEHYH